MGAHMCAYTCTPHHPRVQHGASPRKGEARVAQLGKARRARHRANARVVVQVQQAPCRAQLESKRSGSSAGAGGVGGGQEQQWEERE